MQQRIVGKGLMDCGIEDRRMRRTDRVGAGLLSPAIAADDLPQNGRCCCNVAAVESARFERWIRFPYLEQVYIFLLCF